MKKNKKKIVFIFSRGRMLAKVKEDTEDPTWKSAKDLGRWQAPCMEQAINGGNG